MQYITVQNGYKDASLVQFYALRSCSFLAHCSTAAPAVAIKTAIMKNARVFHDL